jgi:hypothetical protein
MGAVKARLTYVSLPSLIELKLAAARPRDIADVVELMRQNDQQIPLIRKHLLLVHAPYAATFDELIEQAREQRDA